MAKLHNYKLTIEWTGNKGTGTSGYRAYDRSHTIKVENKANIYGSSDPSFLGDKTKHNPEDMLLASLSACHMLWYLHLCSDAGIIVTNYIDNATGIMEESPDGAGRFTEVTLHPIVTITDAGKIDKANSLHHNANKMCYVANSMNFPIQHEPTCNVG